MEELLFAARAQHGAGLVSDAIDTLSQLATTYPAFDKTARNVFGQIFKDRIDAIRDKLKKLTNAFMYQEQQKNVALTDQISIYKARLLTELQVVCNAAISLIDDTLLPNAVDDVSRVFFHKMKGDMYRYVDEHVDNGSSERANESYKKAVEIAKASLPAFHPVRLGVFLNYAVLTYEHLGQESAAVNMLREALMGANSDSVADDMTPQTRSEALDVIRVIQTNLDNWGDVEEEEEEEDHKE